MTTSSSADQAFREWLTDSQAIDPATLGQDELQQWRSLFDELSANPTPKVGLLKLDRGSGHLYGVAIEEGGKLWLTLWVKRSPKGDIYVMLPRSDKTWDPHTSYHRDGRLHSKSFGHKFSVVQKQPPLAGVFKGTEIVGGFAGHAGEALGAVCDSAAFTGIVTVASGILTGRAGVVHVDLVEPGKEPHQQFGEVAVRKCFTEMQPHLVITILR